MMEKVVTYETNEIFLGYKNIDSNIYNYGEEVSKLKIFHINLLREFNENDLKDLIENQTKIVLKIYILFS